MKRIKTYEDFSWTGEKGDYNKVILNIFRKYGMPLSNMISGSKSSYRQQNRENLVFFNSNIFAFYNNSVEKIWYGDLDVTKSKEDLIKISKELKLSLYIFTEYDGRFDNEFKDIDDLFGAQVIINEDKVILSERYKQYFDENTLLSKK
jgi:hypothetical protein